ncbi:MAG: hypothetical protein CVT80_16815 [Alphaproteobacteria bacterium HGW-Alphaproteobacteria-2]|nr:MAG: hypothetical protein CVT80_16815 [Alphaproteobacteria bacterium HGW-Alphaproteobacteria-2]
MTTQFPNADPQRLSGAALFHLFGRTVIGAYFLGQAAGLITADRTFDEAAIAGDLPLALYWANFGFQALAAAAIIVGFQAILAASVLAVHVVWTSWLFNFDPSSAEAMALFWKDVAMVGGLLVVIAGCRSTLSADAMQARHPGKSATARSAADAPPSSDRPDAQLVGVFRSARS